MWILRLFKNAVANCSKHNNLPSSFHRNPDHEFHWGICTLTTAVWNQIQLGFWPIHILSFLNKTKQKVISIFTIVACEWQIFLLAHRRWGTFREEEHLWLSDRNSIPMMQNLSRVRSEALIGQRSSFSVLAIVYEWQTKGSKSQM